MIDAQLTMNFGGRTYDAEKPVETFWLQADPLTGWPIEPAPQYRKCIPVYDADTGELREFIL